MIKQLLWHVVINVKIIETVRNIFFMIFLNVFDMIFNYFKNTLRLSRPIIIGILPLLFL